MHSTVAVIGLGPAGLTALKTLREEGFDAVGFDRRGHAGGLWAFDPETSYTSVTAETVTNISKFISGFSDFPIPKEYPVYFTGSRVAEYLRDYVQHFQLEPHCRLNTTVRKVVRSTSDWEIHISTSDGDSVLHFDKVIFGSGSNTVPKWPAMPGRDLFKGRIVHGQYFRSPDEFAGQRVMVVGLGNTACETAISLTQRCSTVFQSYRRGRALVSRYYDDGTSVDTALSWAVVRLKYFLDYWVPWLTVPLVDAYVTFKMTCDVARHEKEPSWWRRLRLARQKLKEWRLIPFRSLFRQNPVVQDAWIPAVNSKQIVPVHGFKEFVGEDEVLLEDNSTVSVDAVIFCTGYSMDFSVMPELKMDDASEPQLPRLYKMIFPTRYAMSIAFLSWMAPQENVWSICELAAMAVAQIWVADIGSGNQLLPSIQEMERDIDGYNAWWRQQWRIDRSMHHGFVQAHMLFRFLHEKAGTGMYGLLDHVFTLTGWRLWWNDRELYQWLSYGPMNSYPWRLLNTNPKCIPGGGRKAWSGAREAIRQAFTEFIEYKNELRKPREKRD